jgi:acetylornithine deacetylase/succinyl-diaminopimelate desuccinylase-like protein
MKKIILMGCLMPALVFAQNETTRKVGDWRISRESKLLNDYRTFLSIPNIAADTSGLKANAEWIRARLEANGVAQTKFLYPATPGQAPAVYGRVDVPGATRTIALYAHYDGQPVDPSKWAPGLKPFTPQLTSGSLVKGARLLPWEQASTSIDPEWRIYARGASDDKAGVFSIIEAYAALSAVGQRPSANLIFFFEGEEEAGSDHLPEIFERHRDLLKADAWVICDGPVHASGLHQLVHGVRGDTHLDLVVYGPKRPLHSGHYGNWIPNPAMDLAQLLASMKNEKGEVTIKGFYDDVLPLTKAERDAIARIPPVEEQLKKELGVRKPERALPLNEAIALPSLNINGLAAAGVGEKSANVIPVKAEASIDLRLVAGNDWKRQQDKVIAHIRAQGFHVTEQVPTDAERAAHDKICQVKRSGGYNAQKTPMDDPNARRIGAAVDAALGTPAIRVPTLGGSLPLFMFEQILKVRPVTVPIANHDNNQHAENENIRIGNLWKGIEIYASIMTGY